MKTQIREGIQNEMCVERVCERISAASPTPQTHRGETICTATLRLFLLTTIITKKIPYSSFGMYTHHTNTHTHTHGQTQKFVEYQNENRETIFASSW